MTPTQGLIAGAILLIALFVYTFWPDNSAAGQHDKTRLEYLLERQEQLVENMRDLNFEFRAGKYPEDEFQKARAELEAEKAQLQAEIEILQRA